MQPQKIAIILSSYLEMEIQRWKLSKNLTDIIEQQKEEIENVG